MKTPFYGNPVVAGFLLICSLLSTTPVLASVVVTGTRVIYAADAREVTVKLNNDGNFPVLVQSWIDDGDARANPDTAKAPFILTPPIARIDNKKGQTLRIRYTGQQSLPQDKESVFWLNVLELPSSVEDGQNKLKIAFRSRLKLFYRPAGLPDEPTAAASKLEWRILRNGNAWQLDCYNPSAYFVSLNQIKINGVKVTVGINDSLVAPGKHQQLSLLSHFAPGAKVNYSTINDYGAVIPHERSLTP